MVCFDSVDFGDDFDYYFVDFEAYSVVVALVVEHSDSGSDSEACFGLDWVCFDCFAAAYFDFDYFVEAWTDSAVVFLADFLEVFRRMRHYFL